MKQRRRIYYSAAQRSEIWVRWQAGEPMSSIGRRFDRESSSVFSVISPTGGSRVANRIHDGGKSLKLGAAFPHGNQRLVFRRRSQQRRRRIDLFEIAPNCQNLSDRSAIFQNECGHDASRIDCDVGIGALLALGEIDRYKRNSDAFL